LSILSQLIYLFVQVIVLNVNDRSILPLGNKDRIMASNKVVGKASSKAVKQKVVNENNYSESDGEEEINFVASRPAAYTLLDLNDDADDAPDSEDSGSVKEAADIGRKKGKKAAKKKNKQKQKNVEKEDNLDDLVAYIENDAISSKKPAGKKQKKKLKKAQVDEDIDLLLAELEQEEKGGSVPTAKKEEETKIEPAATVEDVGQADVDKTVGAVGKRAKAKAKRKQKLSESKETVDNKAEVKTTAAAAAAQLIDENKEVPKVNQEANVQPSPTEIKSDDVVSTVAESETKNVKKKKKGKDEKENKEKKKRTPADLIKQALKKRQEEEERLRQLELEEEKRIAELERQREEKERLEREKKERKKREKKEKIEKLKKEGKYLTAEQKQKLQRQRERIEMLKQQGVNVPEMKQDVQTDGVKTTMKRPVYADRKRVKKEKPTVTEVSLPKEDFPQQKARSREVSEKDDVIESWDLLDSERARLSSNDEVKKSEFPKDASTESETSAVSDQQQVVLEREKSAESTVVVSHQRQISESQRSDSLSVDMEMEQGYRSPVICVLGHVDTGKTKILDKIRHTHVQDSEAGGITQQIGATFVPREALVEQTKMVKGFNGESLQLPGLLIIDTPGHESFSNLRSRGSSLCDIAVLVVDIMHGLEMQTIESINLLKQRKTPCVVALNKVDRLYDWKACPNKDIRAALKAQQRNAQIEFNERVRETVLQFAQQGLNVALFWENPDQEEYISLVPTSAHTGDGMGNLMQAIIGYCQAKLMDRLLFQPTLQCTVLEVKVIAGLGTTIDVILVNGYLRVGNTIVVAGSEGPIVTQIRELLMPHPLRELRVKNNYLHNKVVKAAQGVKIVAKDLEKALAGLPLLLAKKESEIEELKEELSNSLKKILQAVKLSERGVYVQASTLGSLEALLEFLRAQKIPYFGVNIGPVHKRDVVKVSTMLEHDPQWAVILAFDVKVDRDAQQMADELEVKIFQADIIYHLQDAFLKYREELKEKKRQEFAHLAIFPCKLRVLPQHMYKTRDPIICGVVVEAGILKVGVPLCVPSKEFIYLGNVSSIEQNHKQLQSVRKNAEVCIKIENTTGEAPKMFGRHFTEQDMLVSRISRETIDVCKQYFREDLQKADWQLMVELKKVFEIL
ncbi:Eukaryotic translation initiation factor 5B, partial [Trichinella pseudospiralis]